MKKLFFTIASVLCSNSLLAVELQTPDCANQQAASLAMESLNAKTRRAAADQNVQLLGAVVGKDLASPVVNITGIRYVKFDKDSGFRACIAKASRANGTTQDIGYTIRWHNKFKEQFIVELNDYDFILDTYGSDEVKFQRKKNRDALLKAEIERDRAQKEKESNLQMEQEAERIRQIQERMAMKEAQEEQKRKKTESDILDNIEGKYSSKLKTLLINRKTETEFEFIFEAKNNGDMLGSLFKKSGASGQISVANNSARYTSDKSQNCFIEFDFKLRQIYAKQIGQCEFDQIQNEHFKKN